jgi:hypothetical protein
MEERNRAGVEVEYWGIVLLTPLSTLSFCCQSSIVQKRRHPETDSNSAYFQTKISSNTLGRCMMKLGIPEKLLGPVIAIIASIL